MATWRQDNSTFELTNIELFKDSDSFREDASTGSKEKITNADLEKKENAGTECTVDKTSSEHSDHDTSKSEGAESSAAAKKGVMTSYEFYRGRSIYDMTKNGDLVGVQEVIRKNKFTEYKQYLTHYVKIGDGATLYHLLQSRQADDVASHMLKNKKGWVHKQKANMKLFGMILNRLSVCVTPEHEENIKEMLTTSIIAGCPADILNTIDDLWCKSRKI